jgi:hypothetical protein
VFLSGQTGAVIEVYTMAIGPGEPEAVFPQFNSFLRESTMGAAKIEKFQNVIIIDAISCTELTTNHCVHACPFSIL